MKIKYIIWDVDGTLYQAIPQLNSQLEKIYESQLLSLKIKFPNLPKEKLLKFFKRQKEIYQSKTATLTSLTLGNPSKITQICEKIWLDNHFLKKDKKINKTF